MCRRRIAERNIALHVHKNQFCSIRKSQNFSFKKTIEDKFEPNFKVVDIVISDKQVKSFFKTEYKHKQVQSQVTIMIVYDIETSNTINCIYRISKISGKFYRDITERE